MVRFKSKKLIRNRHAFGVPTSHGTRTTACNVCAGAEPGRKDRFIAQKCHCVSKLWPDSIQCLTTLITYYNHQKSTFCRRIAIVLNIWRSWISVSDAKMTLIWYPSKSTLESPCWIKVRSTGKGVGQPSKLRLFGSWHRMARAHPVLTAPLKRGGFPASELRLETSVSSSVVLASLREASYTNCGAAENRKIRKTAKSNSTFSWSTNFDQQLLDEGRQ